MAENTFLQTLNQAETLSKQGEIAAAIECYRTWLVSEQNEPQFRHAALFNMGSLLRPFGQIDQAIVAFEEALVLKPDFYQAAVNLGLAYEAKGDANKAISIWQNALQLSEGQTLLLNHSGRVFENLKNYAEAEKLLKQSLIIEPDQPDVMQHYLHLRQKKCEWPVLEPVASISQTTLQNSCGPLGILALSDDPALQFKVLTEWVNRKIPRNLPRLSPGAGYQHDKLRIGYMSCDFRWHAVSILIAELFELHDREKFEIYGIDFSVDDSGTMRKRVLAAMDYHLPIHTLSDEAAAQLIRAHEIDILIDLTGLTAGARPAILSFKPAPIQVSYLGFVGTCGMSEIDYILADRFVFPEALTPYFVEKPLYLPNVYQCNDSQRVIGATPIRQMCGLPEDVFVYCSFNGSYKITPDVFAVWMNILKRVPKSILWLVADNEWAKANLKIEAAKRDVDPERIFFADKVGPSEYLARYRVADLLLDTCPYNAGTTASDALWAGLPVLTCSGRAFASRMAGSLLMAVNLPQLVTYNLQEYEDKAVYLAEQPNQIAEMRRQLAENRLSCPLFNTPQFVRELEIIFNKIAVKTTQSIKQTPINNVYNVDVLNFMRSDFTGVVEVGSSSGALARAYRDINPVCTYVGIEIDQDYAEASKQHCTEVIYGNVEKLSDETFRKLADAQCWVFADALEHLYDPWQLLRRIKHHARSGVEVIACIPNAQYWGIQSILNSGRFVYQDSGLLDRTHIRWLTRLTILDLFQANGFQVMEMISRILQQPSDEMISGIRQIASASGTDPDMAVQDSIPFQYVVRAIAIN